MTLGALYDPLIAAMGPPGACRPVDKKLYKELWTLVKRVPLLPIGGSAIWRPLEFLLRVIPVKSTSMTL